MSDTLHSNDLNNKGTKTLLGREIIIRQRRECHGDQVKGHHDWHTLKCVTAYHFNNHRTRLAVCWLAIKATPFLPPFSLPEK